MPHKVDEILRKVRLGMTREEVIEALGEPDSVGKGSSKYPAPPILKYGDVELHFQQWNSGRLWMAFLDDADGNEMVLLK